jgi:hypothetical protein
MNILLVSQEYPPETGWGGIGTYTFHLAHGLRRQGHTVWVLSRSLDAQTHWDDRTGINVYLIPNAHPLKSLRRLRLDGIAHILGWSKSVDEGIYQLWQQFVPDIVEMPLWDAEAFFYGLHPRVPLVIRAETPRTENARIAGFDRRWWAINLKAGCWLEGFAARRALRLIAISQSIARTVQSDYHVLGEKIRVCYLGIPMPTQTSARAESEQIVFLFVGRLEPRKGIQFLLQAIPQVVAVLPKARFVIVGRDVGMPLTRCSYRSYFEEIANAAALAATQFTGFVERAELERLYSECDVFVAPSLYESFGLVHLEAMSYGKPVVAFRSGATPEIVSDQETGLLVEPGNVAALASALIRLGQDRELRKQMGMRGTLVARNHFSVEAMVDRTLEIYTEAIRQWQIKEKKV